MGGDRITPPEERISTVDDFPPQLSAAQTPSLLRNNSSLRVKIDQEKVGKEENGLVLGEFGSDQVSPASWDCEVDQQRKSAVFSQILQSYDHLQTRIESLREAKDRILSYTPGAWIENAGGMKLSDYDVPKTTSLLLIGPKGSGKSSLVNRITKVFEDDKFASERAQVTYNSYVGDGTYFLQEYMIPRGSNSFCLYDTRSLVDDTSDNIKIIKHWITYGVRHGELIIRKSDSSGLRNRMKCKARQNGCEASELRMVNFFIFVLSGLAVLKSMEGRGDIEKQYTQMIRTTFSCPYLSFKDDKPVVIVTHGDLLSLTDRARIRLYLGELLGIPPTKQIFDIPESCDPENELVIVDMLRYCLEHSDRNLPYKDRTETSRPLSSLHTITTANFWRIQESIMVFKSSAFACLHLLIIIGVVILSLKMQSMYTRGASKSDPRVDWHSIRHLW